MKSRRENAGSSLPGHPSCPNVEMPRKETQEESEFMVCLKWRESVLQSAQTKQKPEQNMEVQSRNLAEEAEDKEERRLGRGVLAPQSPRRQREGVRPAGRRRPVQFVAVSVSASCPPLPPAATAGRRWQRGVQRWRMAARHRQVGGGSAR